MFLQGLGLPTHFYSCQLFVSPSLWESQAKLGNWLEITLALSDLSSSLGPSSGSLSLLPQHSHLCCLTPLGHSGKNK